MAKGNHSNKRATHQPTAATPTPPPATLQAPPEPPIASPVEITVSNVLASFLDATIDVLISQSMEAGGGKSGDTSYVQPLCAATLLQLQDWLVRTSHQWSLLPSLRGHTSTGDYTVKSFVKYSCEVLVPMLAASSSKHAVSRLRAMMKQVYGSCVWRSLVDKRSILKEELQEAVTRRRNYSLTNTTNTTTSSSLLSSALLLSEEDFLGVVRPHILNGTSTVGLELTIPAPLLQTVLETLAHIHTHHPTAFQPSPQKMTPRPTSKKTQNNNASSSIPIYNWDGIFTSGGGGGGVPSSSWLQLVKHLNGKYGGGGDENNNTSCATGGVVVKNKGGAADPWLWFSGMHVYEGVSTTNGDGEGEGVTTHHDLFAPVKNSAIEGMHVDSRLVASSSLRFLNQNNNTSSTSPTPTPASGVVVAKRGGHDASNSLREVSSTVYNMFLLPQDKHCSIRLHPSRKPSTTTTAMGSNYTSNLPLTFATTGRAADADANPNKVAMHISNVQSAMEYYRHVDLPLFLRNVEGKCGRLMSVFGSIMAATDSFGRTGTAVEEGDDNGDGKRKKGSTDNKNEKNAVAKPHNNKHPLSHAERMEAIIKAFGSEAEPVLAMVATKEKPSSTTPSKLNTTNSDNEVVLTVQAENRAALNLTLITNAAATSTNTTTVVDIEGYLKIRESRELQDKKRESHLKGLLVINEAIEDSAYRSQITGNNNNSSSSSTNPNNTHQQGRTDAQQLASAQEVGIKNETLSSFLKEASIAFDMRIMSLAAAIVGYAMAHFRGMSPGVCVVFAAVCAALMTMVDALLLFTRLTKDDQARSKKVRSEEHANRAKERKRL